MKKITSLFVILLISSGLRAQMSGVYNIPGDFSTLAAAISSLNAVGVSAPVTINVPAGFTETITTTYTLTATGTAANPIIFQKSGAGANPLITANTGVSTPGSALQDGIWALIGSDYITIDGIDLYDPNTANPASMEYGYGLFRNSTSDGAQNNTIKNCVITLNRVNNASGTAPAVDGSRGINSVSSLYATQTSISTPATAAGTHSNNKFYSNTIQNCNIGIAMIGYAAPSPFTLADTGNDIGGTSSATGNTILNYGGGAATNPAAAIRTLAQYSLNVSYNTINNNNGSGINHATTLRGIFINTATSPNVAVTNNTITIKGGATTSQVCAIENVAGTTAASNTISISNNVITNCTYTTATSGVFYGIYNNGGTPTVLNINDNSFINNSSAATSGNYYNINNAGAATATINLNNNIINGITLASGSSASLRGIVSSAAGASALISINSNSIQAITTGSSGDFYFINNSASSATVLASGNTAINLSIPTTGNAYFIHNSNATNSSTITNNFITGTFTKTGAGSSFYGYYNLGSPTGGSVLVSGNNISNITLAGATSYYGYYVLTSTSQNMSVVSNTYTNVTSGAATLYGIYFSYGNNNNSISNNLISNFSGAAAVYGIFVGSTASTLLNVSTNTINALSSSGGSPVVGYNQTSGTTTNMYKNKIYDLSGSNAGSTVSGIVISSGTTNNIYNNLLGDLRATVSVGANALTGISVTGGTTNNISFNTVNLNSTNTGSLFGSSAISDNGSTTTISLRNNIFVNTSAFVGSGITAAYRRATTTLTNYSTASNNNLFYAGAAGANNLLFYDGTNSVQTLAAYKALMSTRDASSVTENPSFVSITGSNANFLNINTGVPTQVESGAATVSGITDDYAGTVRNVSTPDIGAWEGNYIINDLSAPIFAGGLLTAGCSVTAATYTVNISDNSGVASGTVAPRVYYKINAGAYTSVQGTLASGTPTTGVWSFNLSFAATNGNTLSYYVVAQDILSNLGASPSAGFAGTDVNTVTTAPTTPSTYFLGGTLSGIYNVGAGQTFTTLTQAAQVYNAACLSGPVTFVLTDALYSTSETFPVTFRNNTTASATNSLLIKPNTAVTAAITGISADAMLKFIGADYIKLDGSNNATTSQNLTVENTNAVSSAAVIWIGNSSVSDPASNITINNSVITGSTGVTSVGGIILSSGVTLGATAEVSNNNMTITGNTFLKTQNGIYAYGNATTLDANWTITNNIFGSTVAASKLGYRGVAVQNAQLFSISNNTVVGISNNNGPSVGILAGAALGNGTITANMVSGIRNTSTGTAYGTYGFQLSANTTTAAIMVTNNMITDISGYGSTTAASNGVGIYVSNGAGYKIYHNTVLMNTNQTVTTGVPSAMLIASAVTTAGAIDLRNNIFANTQTVGNGYSIYSAAANTVYSSIDYNDYSTASTNLAYIGSARINLAALQTGFGSNLNSRAITPVFASATDLHLVPASNGTLDNLGTPVGVTIDIDNQTRSLTTPDMGADEFDGPPCTTASGGNLAATSLTRCAGQPLVLSSVGTSTGSTTSFQWQVSTVSGGTYTNVAGGTGATGISYTNTTLPAGTYYLVLQTTCASASLTAVSNEATVTINSTPSASASATSTLICSGDNLSLTASTNIGTNFLWIGPNSFTTNVQNPVINGASTLASGNYTLLVSANSCTSTPAVLFVVISTPPTALTVTPTSAALCSGSSQTLSVSGGNAASTFNFGTQAAQNTASAAAATDYPAPYTMYWGGQKMQILILASELSSAGFSAGTPFTSVQFPVVSRGSNWPATTTQLQSFKVSMGNTALTSLTSFQGSLITVQPATGFTPVVGYSNTHNFTPSAFVWDGTSNVILETTFSNATTGTAADAIVQYNTPTPFQSCIVYRNDGQTAATVAAATSVSYSYSARPDFKLNGLSLGTYAWSPATGLSATSGASVVATPSATSVYTVTSVNGGCSVSNSVAVNVTATPTVNIASTSASVCTGNTATLTASGATTYSWNPASTNTVITVSPVATTNYTVTGYNGTCSGTKTISIGINTTPTVGITSASLTICEGQSSTLSVSGADTYSWSTTSTATNVVVSPTTTTVYSVTGISADGCISNPAVSTVTVNAAPVISVNSATICDGASVIIMPSGADTYTITGGTFTVTPSATASYSVTGTNVNGCISANPAVSTVSINATPVIVVNNPSVCDGISAIITPSGANTYTITGNTFTVTPSGTTSYSVTGTGSNGCVSASPAVSTVSVNATPVIVVNNPSVCDGISAIITPSGANTYTITGNTFTVTPSGTTSYSVTGTGSNGCVSASPAISTVSVSVSPVISVNSATICEGTTVSIVPAGADTYTITGNAFTVSPSATTSYSVTGTSVEGCVSNNTAVSTISVNAAPVIMVNNPTVCEGTSATITPSGAGTYTITGNTFTVTPSATTSYSVTGTGANGCTSLNDAVSTVSVNAAPVIVVNNPAVCDGAPAIITPSGADTYTITGNTFTVTPSTTTSYTVTGTDVNGCTSLTDAVSTVSVSVSPVVSVSSATICDGTSVTIVPAGADTYTITGNTFTVSPSATTSYSVTGTSVEGCVSNNTAVSTISVNASPSLTVATTNTLLCTGETATLTASGADSYSWSSGSATNEEIVTPVTTTVYTVTGTDAINGCQSVATLSQDVSLCTGLSQIQNTSIFNLYPNPNNGEFVLEAPENTTIVITNAIGQVVYSAKTSSVKTAVSIIEFADGIYFVKATRDNNQQVVKVIKK